jgi:biotin synthase
VPVQIFEHLKAIVKDGRQLSREDLVPLAGDECDAYELMYGANLLRRHFKGDTVDLCSILNAKSGLCPEDCKFCAQSARYATGAPEYPLVSDETVTGAAKKAKSDGAQRIGIVTSGPELSIQEFDGLIATIESITGSKDSGLGCCCSLGTLSREAAARLHAAGVRRYHHNIETSRRFFAEICSTHTFDERLETLKTAKAAGLQTCSGGIFGMGETWDDRIDMALTLRELDVDSVPVNFLVPIQGTPLGKMSLLEPLEALKIIALFRFALPQKDIRICAGKETVLRDLQSWIFYAGANATMVGGYLTRPARPAEQEIRMITDLGLSPAPR